MADAIGANGADAPAAQSVGTLGPPPTYFGSHIRLAHPAVAADARADLPSPLNGHAGAGGGASLPPPASAPLTGSGTGTIHYRPVGPPAFYVSSGGFPGAGKGHVLSADAAASAPESATTGRWPLAAYPSAFPPMYAPHAVADVQPQPPFHQPQLSYAHPHAQPMAAVPPPDAEPPPYPGRWLLQADDRAPPPYAGRMRAPSMDGGVDYAGVAVSEPAVAPSWGGDDGPMQLDGGREEELTASSLFLRMVSVRDVSLAEAEDIKQGLLSHPGFPSLRQALSDVRRLKALGEPYRPQPVPFTSYLSRPMRDSGENGVDEASMDIFLRKHLEVAPAVTSHPEAQHKVENGVKGAPSAVHSTRPSGAHTGRTEDDGAAQMDISEEGMGSDLSESEREGDAEAEAGDTTMAGKAATGRVGGFVTARLQAMATVYREEREKLDECTATFMQHVSGLIAEQALVRPIVEQDVETALASVAARFISLRMRLKQTACEAVIFTRAKRLAASRGKRGNFTEAVSDILEGWFASHIGDPYPTEADKEALAERCGITLLQVSNWFGNKRIRFKKAIARACGDSFPAKTARFTNMRRGMPLASAPAKPAVAAAAPAASAMGDAQQTSPSGVEQGAPVNLPVEREEISQATPAGGEAGRQEVSDGAEAGSDAQAMETEPPTNSQT